MEREERKWRIAIVKRYRPHRYADIVQHFDSSIDIVYEIARAPENCVEALARILGFDISKKRIVIPLSMLIAVDISSLDSICREIISEVAKRSDIDDRVLLERI